MKTQQEAPKSDETVTELFIEELNKVTGGIIDPDGRPTTIGAGLDEGGGYGQFPPPPGL